LKSKKAPIVKPEPSDQKMKNGPEYAQFRDYKIMPSTAGFYDRRHTELYSMGSGTFVSIGHLRGLLTCAHVIDAILKKSLI
jgi:hypothetical protein